VITVDKDEWKLKVKSAGWNDESSSDTPEYDVNPEPLGRCPFEEECTIIESPTLFVCERKLKEDELSKEERKQRKEDGVPQSCGWVFPRTVCKREITRDEAEVYLRDGKTELLTDFTSRFGRPFSATLVLKENGRHGFEFPPRKKAGDDGEAPASAKKKTAKKTSKKKTRKKTAKKKTTKKKATRKKAGKKKTKKKTAGKKTGAEKAAATETAPANEETAAKQD
jgi:DNA topoisomerase-3